MTNTEQSFRDKWDKNKHLAFAETLREGSDIFSWIINRNGFRSPEDFGAYLAGKKRILDAGCGNGRVTALLRRYSRPEDTEIIGVDLVAADIAQTNLEGCSNVLFFHKDLMGDLDDLGLFDFIYCQEVLHHTSNPRQAFLNLCRLLVPQGEIAIYVYKKKAPVREFVDDYVRQRIGGLSYEEAMETCSQITELGRMLSGYGIKIKVPDVAVLDIKEGEYDLQRFIYHFFMKCFWNPELTFEENAVINYDWYHPQLCTRHTVAEVREWFKRAGMEIIHEFVDFYGITMLGKK